MIDERRNDGNNSSSSSSTNIVKRSNSFRTLTWFRLVLFMAMVVYMGRMFTLHHDGRKYDGSAERHSELPTKRSTTPLTDITPLGNNNNNYNNNNQTSLFQDVNKTTTTNTTTTTTNITTTTTISAASNITTGVAPFHRYDGVVIVTKVHGKHQMPLLEQSLCLLHHAYNHRVLYDIIVFSTEPILPEESTMLQSLVAPAKLIIVQDNPGLQEMIQHSITQKRRDKFLKRCGTTNSSSITWWSECPGRIAYNWQAEFRAWHIYEHEALLPYHTMLWIDTDAFCIQTWNQDPIHTLISNDLVLLFDNFPRGRAKGPHIQKRILKAYNTTICRLQLDNVTGSFVTKLAGDNNNNNNNKLDDNNTNINNNNNDDACLNRNFPIVHGFFHVSNLDFYRHHLHWSKTLIGDCFLCRKYDDQIAVTVPAAIAAPHKAWDMRLHGIHLNVYHNNYLDGHDNVGGFLKLWNNNNNNNNNNNVVVVGNGADRGAIVDPVFRQSAQVCPVTAGG